MSIEKILTHLMTVTAFGTASILPSIAMEAPTVDSNGNLQVTSNNVETLILCTDNPNTAAALLSSDAFLAQRLKALTVDHEQETAGTNLLNTTDPIETTTPVEIETATIPVDQASASNSRNFSEESSDADDTDPALVGTTSGSRSDEDDSAQEIFSIDPLGGADSDEAAAEPHNNSSESSSDDQGPTSFQNEVEEAVATLASDSDSGSDAIEDAEATSATSQDSEEEGTSTTSFLWKMLGY